MKNKNIKWFPLNMGLSFWQHFLFNEEILALLDTNTLDIMLDNVQQTKSQNKHKTIDRDAA